MSKKSQREEEKAEACKELRKMIKPGDPVYCILRHVSSSGMSRVIDLAIAYKHFENEYPPLPADKAQYPGQRDFDAKPKRRFVGVRIRSIGYLAAKAMGDNWDSDRTGIKVSGCGMDMGFHLVYSLGTYLWPKGTPKPHSRRNGEPDNSGGYALKKEWL